MLYYTRSAVRLERRCKLFFIASKLLIFQFISTFSSRQSGPTILKSFFLLLYIILVLIHILFSMLAVVPCASQSHNHLANYLVTTSSSLERESIKYSTATLHVPCCSLGSGRTRFKKSTMSQSSSVLTSCPIIS
jgi:hypothetical protein